MRGELRGDICAGRMSTLGPAHTDTRDRTDVDMVGSADGDMEARMARSEGGVEGETSRATAHGTLHGDTRGAHIPHDATRGVRGCMREDAGAEGGVRRTGRAEWAMDVEEGDGSGAGGRMGQCACVRGAVDDGDARRMYEVSTVRSV